MQIMQIRGKMVCWDFFFPVSVSVCVCVWETLPITTGTYCVIWGDTAVVSLLFFPPPSVFFCWSVVQLWWRHWWCVYFTPLWILFLFYSRKHSRCEINRSYSDVWGKFCTFWRKLLLCFFDHVTSSSYIPTHRKQQQSIGASAILDGWMTALMWLPTHRLTSLWPSSHPPPLHPSEIYLHLTSPTDLKAARPMVSLHTVYTVNNIFVYICIGTWIYIYKCICVYINIYCTCKQVY